MRSQRGSVAPLVALAMVAAGGASLLLGRLGEAGVARAAARAAADAAALAGAAEGERAAREVALANGATVIRYEALGQDTRVTVRQGPAEAVARARRSLRPAGGGAAAARGGLAPAMRAALARAEQLLGEPVPITSGFRSTAEQAALFANRVHNPFPVAPPGSSMHEKGLAVDVPAGFVPRLLSVAAQAGLCQPYPGTDPIHFEVCG